jgi:hypothetical protein
MIKMSKSWIILCMVFIVSLLTAGEVIAAQGETIRVSVGSAGNEGNEGSGDPSISSDGRYVAFHSLASNLVPNDTNFAIDIFVHDRQTGQTTRVSVNSAGVQGNGDSNWSSISSDGRYVAFESLASNLVPNDTNGADDVFVHDRQTGQTMRVSVNSVGVEGNNNSNFPYISSDGRYVAFTSLASNLVPNDTNFAPDIFVHDRQTGQTTRVSVNSAGVQGNGDSNFPSISSDGRYVAFTSLASNLVPNDTNFAPDIFVHDRQTGQTTRVSVSSVGVQGNGDSIRPYISSDGRYVAFTSLASNLVPNDTNFVPDIFVHDRQTGQTMRVSVNSAGGEGNSESYGSSISSDGRYVAFDSWASNLVPNDTNGTYDVFVHDYLGPIKPVPDIKANGSDGPITITTGDNLSVTIELTPGNFSGYNADWWVLADTSPFGWYYYNVNTGSWFPGVIVTYQGALFNLPSYGVLNTTGLPTGTYTFYFGVDGNMNGTIDMGQIVYDGVEVTITP